MIAYFPIRLNVHPSAILFPSVSARTMVCIVSKYPGWLSIHQDTSEPHQFQHNSNASQNTGTNGIRSSTLRSMRLTWADQRAKSRDIDHSCWAKLAESSSSRRAFCPHRVARLWCLHRAMGPGFGESGVNLFIVSLCA